MHTVPYIVRYTGADFDTLEPLEPTYWREGGWVNLKADATVLSLEEAERVVTHYRPDAERQGGTLTPVCLEASFSQGVDA